MEQRRYSFREKKSKKIQRRHPFGWRLCAVEAGLENTQQMISEVYFWYFFKKPPCDKMKL